MRFTRSSVNKGDAHLQSGQADLFSRLHAFPVLIAPFILLAPVWLVGKAMFWGVVSLQFVPWRIYTWEVMRSGHLPLWNSLNGMGAPLLANYQSGILYPPNWFTFFILEVGGTGWGTWSLTIVAAAHLAWAGLGMVRLTRRLGLGSLGQSISGLAFGLSGYLVARLGFLSINAAVAWLPWVILGVEHIVFFEKVHREDGSPGDRASGKLWEMINRNGWLIFALTMMLLAGHAQTAWYTLILAGLWTGVRAWLKSGGGQFSGTEQDSRASFFIRLRDVGSSLISLIGAVVFAVGLSAIQLLPTTEYLLLSHRASQVGYEFAMTYSFWPWRFLTLLAPDMFGNPSTGSYWGYGNYWEDAIYVGMLPLILGLAAVIKKQRRSIYLLLFILLAFLLALGKNTPVFPWLYENIPSFSMFQAPTRVSIWAVFALALLAGIGVNAWRRPTGRSLYWTRLATAGGFAISLGAGLAWYFLSDIHITFLRASALAGLWAFGTGILALLAPQQQAQAHESSRANVFWNWAVALFVAADLLVAGWGLNPGIERSFYTSPASQVGDLRARIGSGRLYMPSDVEESLKFKRFMRFDTFDPGVEWDSLRKVVLPNMNLFDGIPSVNNFDPLILDEYAQLMSALETASEPGKLEILNLMAVRVVEKMDSTVEDGVIFTSLPDTSRFRLVPCEISVLDANEALNIMLTDKVDLNRQAVIEVEAEASKANPTCNEPEIASHIQIISESPDRLFLKVTSDRSGWLVLSDTWYPDWQAFIDGESVSIPVRRANGMFRAVWVADGMHDVEFVYRPTSFYAGALISLVFLLCFVYSVWRGR